jgi:hypothetical protein
MLRAHDPGLRNLPEAPTPEFGRLAPFYWPLTLVISGVCELWFDSHRIVGLGQAAQPITKYTILPLYTLLLDKEKKSAH